MQFVSGRTRGCVEGSGDRFELKGQPEDPGDFHEGGERGVCSDQVCLADVCILTGLVTSGLQADEMMTVLER